MPREQLAKETFERTIERRQQRGTTVKFNEVANSLREYYLSTDAAARRAFVKTAVRMYANYENKWTGRVNELTGQWIEPRAQGASVNLTVPLLTAHVDMAVTAYTQASPQYNAHPFISNHLNRQLAEMCATIAQRELKRMLTFSELQREAQYLALATVSYRQVTMGYRPDSPVVYREEEAEQQVPMVVMTCQNPSCLYSEKMPMMDIFEDDTDGELNCPMCASPNVTAQAENETQNITKKIPMRLPRPVIEIPNPVNVQRDFNPMKFRNSNFVIKRRRIPKKTAEFYYRLDLSGAQGDQSAEATLASNMQREPLRDDSGVPLFDIGGYVTEQNSMVEETEMWLAPCEYGLLFAEGAMLGAVYPQGLYLLMVGDLVVRKRAARFDIEWIGLQQGVRPSSNTGTGLVHLADMNDVVNNCLSLEYAVLQTHGFPLRILREKYLSQLPQATQTLLATKIPEDVDLSTLIHTEPAANTSGMLGTLPQLVGNYMQFISGNFNPLEGGAGGLREALGSATGAAALEGMMRSRQGLNLQTRLEADIDTMYSILYLLQQDRRNRELFLEEFDEPTVDAFFNSELRSMFYFEPVRGTDEPQSEATNAFKMITFAQNVAPLMGMLEADPESFYDIVHKVGDALNIGVEIGLGRKERNLAYNKITRVKELYKEIKDQPEFAQVNPIELGVHLYRSVTMKDTMMVATIAQALQQKDKVLQQPIINEMQAAAAMRIQAPPIEVHLYDWEALVISYSDWLQSDEGQNAATPVQLAIGLLFTYAQEMKEQKELYEKLKLLSMMPPPEEDEEGESTVETGKGKTKKDGKAAGSTGRPREVSAKRYSEGKTRETD